MLSSISRICSWRILSLLSGIRYLRTSAKAKAIRAWASAGGAKAAISTCRSSDRWAYFGSNDWRHSSSYQKHIITQIISYLWYESRVIIQGEIIEEEINPVLYRFWTVISILGPSIHKLKNVSSPERTRNFVYLFNFIEIEYSLGVMLSVYHVGRFWVIAIKVYTSFGEIRR